jgi:hypothetical protein
LKGLVKVVKQSEASLEAAFVVFVRENDPEQKLVDAPGFRPAELSVFQVDVVDDLADRREGSVGNAETDDHRFERAAVALVRELTAGHVESKLVRAASFGPRLHESELRIRIDEPPHEPCGSDPVDVNALSRPPDLPDEILASARSPTRRR